MHLLVTNTTRGDFSTRFPVLLNPLSSDLHPDSLVAGHIPYSSSGVDHALLELFFFFLIMRYRVGGKN